jgi:hypothetical protein
MQNDALTIGRRGSGLLRLLLGLLCGTGATRGSSVAVIGGVTLWRATILTQLLVRRLRVVGGRLLAATVVSAHDGTGCVVEKEYLLVYRGRGKRRKLAGVVKLVV